MSDMYPPASPPMPPAPPPMQPPGTVPPPPPGGVPPAPQVQPLPWEQPGYPALEGLYETAKLVLTSPSQAFARMSLTGDLGRPLIYAVLFGWLGIVAQQVYGIAFQTAIRNLMGSFHLPGPFGAGGFVFPVVWSVITMVFAPVLWLIGIFIASALIHVFLLLVGGANTGFSSTVRVVCYSSTVQILQIVPLCGRWVAFVWALVLYIVGIAIAHRTTQGKAALAVLIPIVLCCVCVAIMFLAFGAALWAAFGNLGHMSH